MRNKIGILNGEIRYCDSAKEDYLILGRSAVQKGAFRVLWRSGLRSHDFISDIQKDKITGHIENFKASNKIMLNNFISHSAL